MDTVFTDELEEKVKSCKSLKEVLAVVGAAANDLDLVEHRFENACLRFAQNLAQLKRVSAEISQTVGLTSPSKLDLMVKQLEVEFPNSQVFFKQLLESHEAVLEARKREGS